MKTIQNQDSSKYSHSKYHTKLSHVPRPTRRGIRTNPPTATLVSDVTHAEVTNLTPQSEKTTATVPATSQETQEAIEALLLLGDPPNQANLDEDDNSTLMPIVGRNKASVDSVPPVPPPPDVKLASPVNPVPYPGTLLGVAIKTDHVNNPSPTEDEPDNNQEPVDTQPEDLDAKKKMFITKEYGLKKRAKSKRKFKCGVCAMELETVRDYNQYYLDNHPLHHVHIAHASLVRLVLWQSTNTVTRRLCSNVKLADKVLHLKVNMNHIAKCI